jgi:probable phosphoglycerate mutase
LVRHAQSLHHVTDLTGGWTDTDLTELGRRQADRLADRLASELADVTCRFYSSDLKRAAQTAESIARATGLDPTYEAGLKEYNNGLAAGKSWQEAEAMRAPMTEPRVDWRPYPESETLREFYCRVSECMERLMRDPTPLLAVTHGGTIMGILSWWLGLDVDQSPRVEFISEPASLSVLRVNRWDAHVLERLNDTAHLHEMGMPRRILAEKG